MKETFGSFITKIRKIKGVGLRELARLVELSPEHLCNIEKDRRSAPSYEIQYKIAETLKMTKEEAEILFDLAIETKPIPNNVSGDIVEYINNNKNLVRAIRIARDTDISNEQWTEFIEQISNK